MYVCMYSVDGVQNVFALVFDNLVHLGDAFKLVGQVQDVLSGRLQCGEIVAYRHIHTNTYTHTYIHTYIQTVIETET